jgi:replicative DNA helicase
MPLSEILDRAPPTDVEAEKALLGTLLLAPDRLSDIGSLQPSMFSVDGHRRLFELIVQCEMDGETIDHAIAAGKLREAGILQACGGAEYLAELMHGVAVTKHAGYYAKRVRKAWVLRSCVYASMAMLQDCWKENNPDELLKRMEERLAQVAAGLVGADLVPADVAIEQAVEEARAIVRGRGGRSVLTGFWDYDDRFGGLFPGELVVVAARPGIGKTSLATQIAHHVSRHRGLVYMATLEMASREVAMRLLCGLAGVSHQMVRTAKIGESELGRIESTAAGIKGKLQLVWDDRPAMTTADIARACRKVRREGLVLVVVDYLQRITPRSRKPARYEQVGEIARDLKRLARELDVPVITLAQLSRAAEEAERPTLAHIRESGDVEAEADVVSALYPVQPPDGDDASSTWAPGDTVWSVLKNRNGATGDVALRFDPSGTLFRCRSEVFA